MHASCPLSVSVCTSVDRCRCVVWYGRITELDNLSRTGDSTTHCNNPFIKYLVLSSVFHTELMAWFYLPSDVKIWKLPKKLSLAAGWCGIVKCIGINAWDFLFCEMETFHLSSPLWLRLNKQTSRHSRWRTYERLGYQRCRLHRSTSSEWSIGICMGGGKQQQQQLVFDVENEGHSLRRQKKNGRLGCFAFNYTDFYSVVPSEQYILI